MINDLDETLVSLLKKELPKSLANVQVSFCAPDNQFPPTSVALPAINIFLYDIRENLELRSNEVFIERGNDARATSKQAPIRVDVSYLITAWPASVINPSEDEHRILGDVMRVLLRHRTIPSDVLQGSLVEQVMPLPVSCLQSGRLQSLGEFWQALGGKPKVALNYTVTLAVDIAEPKSVDLVTEKVIKMRMESNPSELQSTPQ